VPVPEGEEWRFPPFEGEVHEGRLYGRGSLDMKGPCGAMMWAAREFAERKGELKGRVQLHLVCDEEVGGTCGSGAVARAIKEGELPRPSGIISGELSHLQVRTAERGIYRFKIRFHGRSAHTARARVDGLNAIAVASRGVLALEKHIDNFHPSVGYPVMSINKIEGGATANQVPASCTFLVDWRLVPGETPDSILEYVRKTLDSLDETTEDGRHLPVEYDLITEADDLLDLIPPNMTDSRDPFVESIWQVAEEVLGCRPEPFTDWGGSTDARFYRELEVPVVIFGPTGGGFHGADEHVDLAALGACSEIYRRTLAPLVGLKTE
jgi:acetylornithine deacetylase/succinyl-diaminopimelate desuccinylase-like protein